jgi:hypothetical protein
MKNDDRTADDDGKRDGEYALLDGLTSAKHCIASRQ